MQDIEPCVYLPTGSIEGYLTRQARVTQMEPMQVLPPSSPSPPPLPPPPPPPPLPPSLLSSPLSKSPLDSPRCPKLRKLNWDQIPRERVMGRRSVWTGSDEFRIDVASLDELFGQKASQTPAKGCKTFMIGSPQALTTCTSTPEKVSILQGKRSLNVGIFLRHFRSSVEEIIEDVRRGHGQRYGSEKLKELYKLLPDREEEKRLRTFQGHHSQLEQPDLFLFLLIGIPSFRLRLEAMILKADFDPILSSITNSASCLASAARELMNCAELHSILRLVLKAGNYINAGGYAGNAAGFHIVSLLKLAETKTNKPGMTLLHFVAMEAVKKDPCLLSFQHKISHVEPAARLSEDVVKDLSQLQKRITALQSSSHAEPELQKQNKLFLQRAVGKLKEAEEEVKAMLSARQSLLDFFCEDETTFKLEEACSIFHSFQMCFHRAVQENKMREQQEERQVERAEAERARAKARAAKRRSIASCTALEAEWSADANELAASLESTLMKGLCHTFHRRTRATASSRPRPTLRSLIEQEAEDGEAEPQHQHQLGGQRGRLVRSSRKLQATASLFPTDAQQSPSNGETSAQSSSSSPMDLSFTAIPRPRLLAQPAQSMEHVRPRVGETHTLVKGLCSYKSLTLPPPRTPPLSRYSHSHSHSQEKEKEEVVEEEMETEEAQVTQPTQSTASASPAISRTQRASLPRRWRVAQGSNKTASLTSTPASRLGSTRQKTEPEERGRKANPLRRLLEKAKPDKDRTSSKDKEQREKSKERELLDKADKQREKKEKEEQKEQKKNAKKEKKEKESKKDKERGRAGVTDDKTETQKESEGIGETEATAMECDYGSMAVSRLPSTAPVAVPMPVPHGHCLPRMLQSSMVTTARALRTAVITATAAAKRDRSRSSTPAPSPNPNKGLASRMPTPVPAQDVASQITRM
ncbi:FH2 domain-containing protein 1-like [Engraulis encrasicolus]|uniref:FH2 domain-containing protein 1-like n=1 Tax=Engraulis encrasicolus TaxID=184585 RepID=UPI002FD0BD49